MKQSQVLVIQAAILVGMLVDASWSFLDYNYAQPQQPPSTAVKIISPVGFPYLPYGEILTINGTARDNSTNQNCKVSVTVNGINQPVIAIGINGPYNYSQWTTNAEINNGTNTITAKYSCNDIPSSVSFDTVNIVGIESPTPLGDGAGLLRDQLPEGDEHGGITIEHPECVELPFPACDIPDLQPSIPAHPGSILPAQLILRYLY